MNADGCRWVCRSFLFAMLGVEFVTTAHAEDFQLQLGAEIERRFEDASIDFDVAPLKFGCQFSEYVSSRATVYVTKFSKGWLIPSPAHGSSRLESPASLPQPTLVETFISKGFPSGELSRDATLQDDPYLFAREECTFSGMKFSR
jgi:hypothetical protein